MQIRKKYDKAEALTTHELQEAYDMVRVKYKMHGIDLPERKVVDEVTMDPIEQKILSGYAEKEDKQTSVYNIVKTKETNEPIVKNKMSDIRHHLFQAIEDLKSGKIDCEKAKQIAEIGQVIVNSAKVEVDFIRTAGLNQSTFFEEKRRLT